MLHLCSDKHTNCKGSTLYLISGLLGVDQFHNINLYRLVFVNPRVLLFFTIQYFKMTNTSNNTPQEAKHSSLLARNIGNAVLDLFQDVSPLTLLGSLDAIRSAARNSKKMKARRKKDRNAIQEDMSDLQKLLVRVYQIEKDYHLKASQFRNGPVIVPTDPSIQYFLETVFA